MINESVEKITIIDDDPSIRKSLSRILSVSGYEVFKYASADEFLATKLEIIPDCILLDIHMPGMSGMKLQKKLAAQNLDIPTIFLTGHGDIVTSVTAMKRGAADYLEKPVDSEDLLNAISTAIAGRERTIDEQQQANSFKMKLDLLTKREYEVLQHVAQGKLNKQIADTLSIIEKTVKVHRGQVMGKLEAGSAIELARMVEKFGLISSKHH